MMHAVHLIFVWALTACTTPDLMAPLVQARDEFTAFSTGIEEHLLHGAEEEREREERRAIAADGGVIGFVDHCDTTVARLDASGMSDCRLVEYSDPNGDAGSASELVDAEGKDDPVAYVEAIENARTTYATFLKAQENSPVINFHQFRKSHAQLLARTRPGADQCVKNDPEKSARRDERTGACRTFGQ